MNKQIATRTEPRTCGITLEELSEKDCFVLPCCKQDVAKEAILTWLKQPHEPGCPCCRDPKMARDALLELGCDLTPIVGPKNGSVPSVDELAIFDSVMTGISAHSTMKRRCQKYREFGLGLMRQNHYPLAHRLIHQLREMFYAEAGQNKVVLGATIVDLLDAYNRPSPVAHLPTTPFQRLRNYVVNGVHLRWDSLRHVFGRR